MTRFIWICFGGAVGTGARYLLGGFVARVAGPDFPYGTLLINVLGSFLIGVVQQVGLSTLMIPDTVRLVLAVGVMGGFTTYSSFSYETVKLVETGSWSAAGAYVVLTTTLCLVGCVMGLSLGRVLVEGKGGW
ncbi:MAG TPA: fluoride efflux transporter CrcB [Candidatus Dormibacteraeota bacterium]|jgi:fluoride exporter|nr:fluoride efflux transporter CrcB [Candidatus Dormibacteraeota bacterium]